MCEICGKGHDEDSILLCDACTGICLSVYLIISPSLHLHSSIYVCVSVCVCVCLCVCVSVGSVTPCSRTTLMAPAKVVTALSGPRDSSRLFVWVYRPAHRDEEPAVLVTVQTCDSIPHLLQVSLV